VDSDDPMAPFGEEQGVFAGAAAGIEDRAGDPVGDPDKRPLRLADVPRRRPSVEVLKAGTVYRIGLYRTADGHGHKISLFLGCVQFARGREAVRSESVPHRAATSAGISILRATPSIGQILLGYGMDRIYLWKCISSVISSPSPTRAVSVEPQTSVTSPSRRSASKSRSWSAAWDSDSSTGSDDAPC